MFETIILIVFSVSLFGIVFFLYVKKKLKKQLEFIIEKEKKNNKLKN